MLSLKKGSPTFRGSEIFPSMVILNPNAIMIFGAEWSEDRLAVDLLAGHLQVSFSLSLSFRCVHHFGETLNSNEGVRYR